ncbi:MAG: HAD-IC family P-type ATPase [Eubacteriales bacterium]|nr:HAD-IC family P-type ATPase [Eubacteriales bacterium]
MKFIIKHEIKGRIRVHIIQNKMTYAQADILAFYLNNNNKYVTFAKVHDRTSDATINYIGDREEIITLLKHFRYDEVEVLTGLVENSGRELNAKYQEKLVNKVIFRYAGKLFLPYPIRACVTTVKSVKYICKGLNCLWHRKIEVPVLDATAIGVSVIRSDFETAGSVMFLLGIGELLEEWTHKKSVDDLARTMSLNVGKVWLVKDDNEVLVPSSEIEVGDKVVVRMGKIIPFDGQVTEGKEELFKNLPNEYSHLYLAIGDSLAAVICIEDPLREEAEAVINSLRRAGISKIVMMTGDSDRTAKVIAKKVGVDEYYSEVLPEVKAKFVEKEKSKSRKLIMIGDGINDSPALSAADVGIAISDGAEIAREIADITIGSDDLYNIVTLKLLSDSLMKRISKNYRNIVGFNTGLILLGVSGIIQPTTSALFHNTSTLLISLKSMQNLLN